MSAAKRMPHTIEPLSLYERDFHAWAGEQAALLAAGETDRLDLANLAEEIGDLGRSEFRSYVSAFRVLLLHMLKWDRQPEKRTRSWLGSINVQRIRLERIKVENPSLRSRTAEAIAHAYREARVEAAVETGLSINLFEQECPYELAEILTRPFELD